MIEQINIALSLKKGPGISQPGSLKPVKWITSKEAYTFRSKVMENEHPRSYLEQDIIVNSLNYEGIAVIELVYHFPDDSDRLRVGSVTD